MLKDSPVPFSGQRASSSKRKHRKEVNIKELRKTLKESLKNNEDN